MSPRQRGAFILAAVLFGLLVAWGCKGPVYCIHMKDTTYIAHDFDRAPAAATISDGTRGCTVTPTVTRTP